MALERDGRYEVIPLPAEAQLAPAFGVVVADADGDGKEDIFLAQNFFATDEDTPRYDAGRGLWLRGDGAGGLEPVPGAVSGIAVYGDQRSAAVADYDGDGRVDLVIGQNGAETRLYQNVGTRPGLRVRLRGLAGNASGIGAVARVVYDDGGLGPAREIKAGSGHLSHDDPVPVLGLARTPRAVRVTWPGGATTETPVPEGAREIEIAAPGASP